MTTRDLLLEAHITRGILFRKNLKKTKAFNISLTDYRIRRKDGVFLYFKENIIHDSQYKRHKQICIDIVAALNN